MQRPRQATLEHNGTCTILRMHLRKMLDKAGNILNPLPQRRHLHRDDVQTVKKILPKPARGALRLQITVRRSHHAHVDGDLRVAADGIDNPLLQYAQ